MITQKHVLKIFYSFLQFLVNVTHIIETRLNKTMEENIRYR